jgi:hypothetical protein
VVSLRTGASLDYEAQSVYTLSLIATDSDGATGSTTITVNVADVNEAPAFTGGAAQTASVPEGSSVGTIVGSPFAATDPDSGAVVQYKIDAITPVASVAPFTVDGLTGALRVAVTTLDYEGGPRWYAVKLNASDNGKPSLSVVSTINVTISNVDEPPAWAAASLTRTINENSAPGTKVGAVLSAPDPEGAAVTFAFQGSYPYFNLTAAGQLAISDLGPDYEAASTVTLVVVATDAGGLTSTASVEVTVNDVNEAPVFPVDAGTRLETDAAATGTYVGAPVRATDPDRGQSLTYTLSATSYFSIDAVSGQISVKSTLGSVASGITNYTVTVTATDNGSPTKATSQVVLVQLTTGTVLNRAPKLSAATVSVTEAASFGTVVYNVSSVATDPDGDKLNYALVNSDPVPFAIGLTSGLLTVAGTLDYESVVNYTLWLQVTDVPPSSNGTQVASMSVTVKWVVNILDANEKCALAGAAFSLDENVPAGTVVGTPLRATDPDTVQLAAGKEWVAYTITSGNTGSVFKLVTANNATKTLLNSTQLVVAKASVNFEAVAVFNLDITGTDAGGLTCVARVDVTINNKNDPPVLTVPSSISVAERSAVGANVGNALSTPTASWRCWRRPTTRCCRCTRSPSGCRTARAASRPAPPPCR